MAYEFTVEGDGDDEYYGEYKVVRVVWKRLFRRTLVTVVWWCPGWTRFACSKERVESRLEGELDEFMRQARSPWKPVATLPEARLR